MRRAAATLLGAIVDRRTPMDGLTDDANGHPHYLALSSRDRALVRAILLAALRYRSRLEAVIAHRLERPLPASARSLSHHLHVGAAQILLLDVPDRAAVDLAVEAAGADPRARRFAPLVNAILRRLGREKEKAVAWLQAEPPLPPDWLRDRLVDAYGDERTAAILVAHATLPALDLTVKADPEAWAARLGGVRLPTGTVRIADAPTPVPEMEGFAEGAWWVQDAAAALPARMLGDVAGRRVLDLCAAPGGKTAQIAHAGGIVTAVERNGNRAERLRVNLDRLGLSAELIETDALDFEPTEPFEAVLLDAPCSSTGTIRRHPDVAWTKTAEDVAKLADLQSRLLAAAARHVAPGGRLVFANCSILPEEGEDVTAAFLGARPDFELDPIAPNELGDPMTTAAMVLPDGRLRTTPDMLPAKDPRMAGLDAFHAARFVRTD